MYSDYVKLVDKYERMREQLWDILDKAEKLYDAKPSKELKDIITDIERTLFGYSSREKK